MLPRIDCTSGPDWALPDPYDATGLLWPAPADEPARLFELSPFDWNPVEVDDDAPEQLFW